LNFERVNMTFVQRNKLLGVYQTNILQEIYSFPRKDVVVSHLTHWHAHTRTHARTPYPLIFEDLMITDGSIDFSVSEFVEDSFRLNQFTS
jgi:hypothetical protein